MTILHWVEIVGVVGAAWTAMAIGAVILHHLAHDHMKKQRIARARERMRASSHPAGRLAAAVPPSKPPAPMPPRTGHLWPVRPGSRPVVRYRCGGVVYPCAADLACRDMEQRAQRIMRDEP